MTDQLCAGPIIHQVQRPDGTWQETPGWMSVDSCGNVVLSVVEESDQQIIDAIGGLWR